MVTYALTVFLAAFLLFQIQPIIAKIILPWFGGSSSVWSLCMLFFQITLLLGYLYAHWLSQRFRPLRQLWLHAALLAASLALLPVMPNPAWRHSVWAHPSWSLLGLLSTTVGLPYFVLSTTSPLLQSWYARSESRGIPFRLFAISNLASLLALVCYPFLIEPRLTTRAQANLWSIGYLLFTVLCAWTAWRSVGRIGRSSARDWPVDAVDCVRPGWPLRLLWLVLAAIASALLLATTTFLTQDVAAVPFLWILPLAVYLFSFVICFEAPRVYFRPLFYALLPPALGVMAYMLSPSHGRFDVATTTAASAGALFVFSMVCHGEIVRRKPHPRYLTVFYVMLSVGGATGGLFVGLLAPNLFSGFYEFPIALATCAVFAATLLSAKYWAFFRTKPGFLLFLFLISSVVYYLGYLTNSVRDTIRDHQLVVRNFYGQLRLRDSNDGDDLGVHRKLIHGAINHGEQILNAEYRRRPISYFCPESGVGQAMSADPGRPRRIGVLGLGCGTLTAYGRPGDVFRIYEINPLVLEIARRDFFYLKETSAKIETVLGDGRLSLEREPDQEFDILVMDAFSGDSVPVHLITREALATYFRHLKPDGILAVNISNRYLDLRPVLEREATSFGRQALYYAYTAHEGDTICFSNGWILIMAPGAYERHSAALGQPEILQPFTKYRAWTDDFSNLFEILR